MNIRLTIGDPWELSGAQITVFADMADVRAATGLSDTLRVSVAEGETLGGVRLETIDLASRHEDQTLAVLAVGGRIGINAIARTTDAKRPVIRFLGTAERIDGG